MVWRLRGTLLVETLGVGSDVSGPEGGEGGRARCGSACGGGVDGGEKLGDGGLGGVGGEAVTFAWWWVMAVHACGGTRGREGRGWR